MRTLVFSCFFSCAICIYIPCELLPRNVYWRAPTWPVSNVSNRCHVSLWSLVAEHDTWEILEALRWAQVAFSRSRTFAQHWPRPIFASTYDPVKPGSYCARPTEPNRLRRRGRHQSLPRVFRRLNSQQEHPGGLRPGGVVVPVVVRGSGRFAGAARAGDERGLHREAPRFGSDGQAAPGRDPDALRLPGRAPDLALEAGELGLGAEVRHQAR